MFRTTKLKTTVKQNKLILLLFHIERLISCCPKATTFSFAFTHSPTTRTLKGSRKRSSKKIPVSLRQSLSVCQCSSMTGCCAFFDGLITSEPDELIS